MAGKNWNTRSRDLVIACGVVLLVVGILSQPLFQGLNRLDVDVLRGLQAHVWPSAAMPDSPVVVVAIDEQTHASAPFSGLPKVMWTPQIAAVQDAVLGGGAAVFGWDVILPTSASAYVADRQYDRPLLRSLAVSARSGRVVLGDAQIGSEKIAPHRALSLAVRGAANIRPLSIVVDDQGIAREVPLMVAHALPDGGTGPVPSMSLELASRAMGAAPAVRPDGTVAVGDRVLSGSQDNPLLVNFRGGTNTIPTYSFADLHACARSGNADYFRHNFNGKVVLFGLVLDIEDRKLTSNRFAGEPDVTGNVRPCIGQASATAEPVARTTTPGVYLHAMAVRNIMEDSALVRPSAASRFLATVPLPLIGALLFALLGPVTALLCTAVAVMAWTGLAGWAFDQALVMPFLTSLVGCVASAVLMVAYRFLVADKDRRFLARAFSSYVSPNVVKEIVANPDGLKLGGERRECTFVFTDLADYTSLVEKSDPERLLPVLNAYMDGMISIAFKHQGTVDKMIGDALVIMFSAPVRQDDHADRAVACALEMLDFARDFAARQRSAGMPFGDTRIGVNTGHAMVGNFGGNTLFDYTAQGDAVNVAARLESVNKALGTNICVSGDTVARCLSFFGRPVGVLYLKGKDQGTEAFEPVRVESHDRDWYKSYLRAYDAMKSGDTSAADRFSRLRESYPDDPVVVMHADRLNRGEEKADVRLSDK